MPAHAGIQQINLFLRWIPAYAGMSGVPYAAAALAGFSGGVIAPDILISAMSLSE
jgi:hypothetical protein